MTPASEAPARRSAEPRPHERARTLVIIPAKDESASLPGLLAELAPHHPPNATLVVDDGSEDDTAILARQAGCRVVQHPFNLGYGAALLTGYHYALGHGFTHIVQMDGDGQHPPDAIERLLAPLVAGEADLVVGSRYLTRPYYEYSRVRRIAALPMAWLATVWTGRRITDPTSGFQAISPTALALLCSDGFPEDYPDVDVLIWLHLGGVRLHEIPVVMRPRKAGRSMHGSWRLLYYFYRLALCLLLLPVRRDSPYRVERGNGGAP